MGEIIDLAARRAARLGRPAPLPRSRPPAAYSTRLRTVQFHFDLACPFTYLAAERVERSFEHVAWRPAFTAQLPPTRATDGAFRAAAERRAAELRLPLVWPERHPEPVPAAMRAAAYAIEQGRGAAFVLAAGRLAFCGGYDLDDPEILAEAAAAAGIGLPETLAAARDHARDEAIAAAGRALLAAGAERLPLLRIGRSLHSGERQVAVAAAAARCGSLALVR